MSNVSTYVCVNKGWFLQHLLPIKINVGVCAKIPLTNGVFLETVLLAKGILTYKITPSAILNSIHLILLSRCE